MNKFSLNRTISIGITDTLMLGLLTGFLYFLTYTFATSYFAHFQIPDELLIIDVQTVLTFSHIVLTTALILFLFWWQFSNWLAMNFPKRHENALYIVFTRELLIYAIFIFMRYSIPDEMLSYFYYTLVLPKALHTIFVFVAPILNFRKEKLSYTEMVRKQLVEVEDNVPDAHSEANAKGKGSYLRFAMVAFLCWSFSGRYGTFIAKRSTSFLTFKKKKTEMVVLTSLGSSLLIAPLCRGAENQPAKYLKIFTSLQKTELKDIQFRQETLPKLSSKEAQTCESLRS